MDTSLGKRIIDLKSRVVDGFDAGNWEELGLLTDSTASITGHSRLLRSLSWGDEDYASNALQVLRQIVQANPKAITIIEDYLDERFPRESTYISAKPSVRRITFAPYAFQIPDGNVEVDLVALMMPFAAEFAPVRDAVKLAATKSGLRCCRVDDVWEDTTIVQDIFSLIFRSQVVVVDFTGRNPNVMYETGIAHTLGKHVIPIAQSLGDVPFDMRHHRVLLYLGNGEGLAKLSSDLSAKLRQMGLEISVPPAPVQIDIDDTPF